MEIKTWFCVSFVFHTTKSSFLCSFLMNPDKTDLGFKMDSGEEHISIKDLA